LRFSYDKFGILTRTVRVKKVTRGGPLSPDVRVTVQEEETRDSANDYQTPAENFAVPGTVDGNGEGLFPPVTVTPRLSWLPDELKTGGGIRGVPTDGLLVAINRANAYNISGNVWGSWNTDPGFKLVDRPFTSFPAAGSLIAFHRINSTRWWLRVQMETDTDYEMLQALIETSPDTFCVVGRRNVRTVGIIKSEHQVLSPWLKVVNGGYSNQFSANTWDIEVQGAFFGTDDLRLEGASADGYFPCTHVFFGRQTDFFIYSGTFAFESMAPNDRRDTDLKRYIRVPVATHTSEQAPTDATPVSYDRDDTTMCADGTFSQEWGAAGETTYEMLNVEGGIKVYGTSSASYPNVADIDRALGAILYGTAATDQALVGDDIDTVLGAMISDGHLYYGP
jgi:hypothetical protein